MIQFQKKDINKYLNFLIIAYAFSFPISKAGVNLIELVVVLLWIYQGNWKVKYELLKSSKFIIVLYAFIFLMIFFIPFASNTIFAVKYILKYHHFLMILIIYTVLEKRYIKYIFSAFILSMLISELISYGIYFNLFTYGHATHEMPTPFMDHIAYSVLLAFTSTILLTNFFSVKSWKYKFFDALFFVTVVTNLFINGGRTGQVVFAVLMFVLSFIYIRHKLKALFFATTIVFVTFLLAYNFSDNFVSRVHQFKNGIEKIVKENDYRGQGGMRAAMWIIGTNVFIDNPVTGAGIGNVMKEANEYADKYELKTRDMNIFADYDNVFINIPAQLGIFGLLLFLLIFYFLLKLPFKTRQYSALNIMFTISFILFSMMHNTMHLMNSMVYFALFTGLFSGISRLESQKQIL
ncbi:O-antigen ligase family protein [Sulfurimonas sp. SWIR-19]|uniref:O-antigen ligase family protein n=1 Tax=Sulfurimonas sp. SWIR-19 TaxID=2878390 RepID=UPI001CF58637|nr:O-antigen ligase family protein [Sulfurimonas sp. SWIR-19]UCN00610.1 O-antigen ligase family protein [Sulfurimonas sp. SWIR-19]